jgi:hypothetical protein
MDTLSTLVGYLRQFVPEVPLGLAQAMINDAYRALINFPPDGWSMTYGQAQFICYQSITGNCYAIQGSNLIQQVMANNGIAAFTVNNPGSGNAPGDVLTLIPYSGGQITVDTVNGSGGMLTGHVSNAGANVRVAQNVPTFSSGSGTGTTLNVTALGTGQLYGDRTTIVGRQALFAGQAPIYSIVDNDTATEFTLDQGYSGTTGIVSFEITSVYWTASDPNLKRLMCLTDPPNGCQLPTSFNFEELNNIDAQRSQSGTPYLLADVDINAAYLALLPDGVTDSYGQSNTSQPVVRKELYPRQQANYAYSYFYEKWIPDLTPANPNPISYFARRGDVIKKRAMAELVMWEGPQILGRKANPVAHNIHMADFYRLAQDLQMTDQSIMQRSYQTLLAMTKYPFPDAYYGSSFAQVHPFLTADVGVPYAGDW